MSGNKRQAGIDGEIRAEKFLKKNGYKIVERNFHSCFGEIDIVAEKDKYFVFVEVKYRSGSSYGTPQDSVDRNKQKKIARTALQYMKVNGLLGNDARFDVVAIGPEKDNVELITNAFESELRSTY